MTALQPADVQSLCAHLERQLASARVISALLDEQHEAIVSRDVQAVVQSVFSMQAEIARRTGLDQERDALLARAAEALGTEPERLTLSIVCAASPDRDAAEHAAALSAELAGILEASATAHQANRELIEQELAFVNVMLQAIGAAEEDISYNPNPRPEGQAGAGFLDVRG